MVWGRERVTTDEERVLYINTSTVQYINKLKEFLIDKWHCYHWLACVPNCYIALCSFYLLLLLSVFYGKNWAGPKMRIGWGSDQGDVRGAITEDEVTTGKESLVVIGVDWTPLQSEGVVAEFDQSLAIARVTTSGSTPGLVRRTSEDPITLWKVTSKSTEESWCISSSVLNWVSWTSLSDVFYLFFSYMRVMNHNLLVSDETAFSSTV